MEGPGPAMKIVHLSHSDGGGGAARAAYRLHQSLRASGVDSEMFVNSASAADWTVFGPETRGKKFWNLLRGVAALLITRTLKTSNPVLHSPAFFRSAWPRKINSSDADVVHIHWTAGEMLSIADLRRIKKPIVWTLHDMWAFSGAEHYSEDFRWRDGYFRANRPVYESGFDLNRWTWRRKRRAWRRKIQVVAPSSWLVNCAKESKLMKDWPVEQISLPLDVHRWEPVDQSVARGLLGLPNGVPVLLFGAAGGGNDPRKGFDLLLDSTSHLEQAVPSLHIVIFGQLEPPFPPNLGFPLHYVGHLTDDLSLRLLYSACDVFALPSRQDNLPLTVVEALSCGTPVVAFDHSGPPSIVRHKNTGYLAKYLDSEDFATGIAWVLGQMSPELLRINARKYAEQAFDAGSIAGQHLELYRKVLASAGTEQISPGRGFASIWKR